MRRVLAACLLYVLPGCASQSPIIHTEYQRVEVPVSVRAVPPAELTAPVAVPPGLTFISPDDPRASSALTAQGESALTELVNEYVARLAAWNAWAAP